MTSDAPVFLIDNDPGTPPTQGASTNSACSAGGKRLIEVQCAGGKDLIPVSFEGREAMCDLFAFTLGVVSFKEISAADILGKPATVILHGHESPPRHFHGVCAEIWRSGDSAPELLRHQLVLRPSLWLLTNASDCRIFQDRSIVQITETLLKKCTDCKVRFAVSDVAHEPIAYCVQYNDTDYAFLRRLWLSAGLFFYFEHDAQGHTLVISDMVSGYRAVLDEKFRRAPAVANFTGVHEWRRRSALITGGVALSDHNFATAGTDLTASCAAAGKNVKCASLEHFRYPGGYTTRSAGEAAARRAIGAYEAAAEIAEGRSDHACLSCGVQFELDDDGENGQRYAITSVAHDAREDTGEENVREATYTNKFSCIPADVVFRVPAPPRPVIAGPQTATVVGPASEDVYCDEFGRVRLQFHWDRQGERNEHSSCWVRVAQALTGPGWGAQQLPRIGMEVVVLFLDGDPDHPIVVGAAPNSGAALPWPPPEGRNITGFRSRSTSGAPQGAYNEVLLDDSRDEERFSVRAQRDFQRETGRNDELCVKQDRAVTVGGKLSTTVQGSEAALDVTDGHLVVRLGGGDIRMTCDKGAITLTAQGGIRMQVGDNSVCINSSGVEISALDVSISGKANVSVKAPQAGMTGEGMLTLSGGIVKIN